jgi:hypothetical protein
MSSRLVDRLRAARHRQFVGRAGEQALFQSALTAAESPFYVLHIFGPGGVGKTSLLRELTRICDHAQTPAFYIDARTVEPSPESLIAALRGVMGLSPPDSPLDVLGSQLKRPVLLIDTYEALVPLDGWLREVFLPQLPGDTLVVLAGRNPPTPAWRTDPGWQALLHPLPLRNLSPEESRAYLTQRAIPQTEHDNVLTFTHGHPLALSLVADVFDQRPDLHFQPEAAPDVLKTLLEHFLQQVPGPAHRATLEACALVHLITETLLSEMLTLPDVHGLFEWLRGLSFIESGPLGLSPHDLAREVLVADVRWRNPDWYAELHRRARTYYSTRLQQTHGVEQQRILFDYIFLHRDNPVVRPFFEWQASGGAVPEAMCESDKPALLAMVARHEGDDSARFATHWLERQPRGVLVFRDAERQPAGFMALVALHQATPEDRNADPAAQAAWDYLQHHAPLRPGEGATLFRFWMARDTYQAVSATQSLIFVNAVRHYLTTPGLAFTFLPCAEPDFWAPMFAYGDLMRLPEADFKVGGRRYGMYGHDWRAVPPMAWLALLAEREVAAEPQAVLLPPAEPLAVLSESAFAEAVRDALRDFVRPDALHDNPLLRSRLVMEQVAANAGEAERAAALQTLIKDAAEALQSSPRETKFYRALYHTYLQPAPTQEQAAELLDLPFSTFRRHLTAGIARVTEMLWQRELGVLD